MNVNPRSVRFRTTAGAVVALAALLALAGLLISQVVGREIEQAFDDTLVEQARDRAALLNGGADPASLTSTVGEEAIVLIVGADGQVLASAGAADPAALVDLPVGVSDQKVVVVDTDGSGHHDDGSDESLRTAVVDSPSGVRVVVGSELEQSRQAISSVRTILLGGVPVLAVLAGAIAWLVTGRALAPVNRMHDDLGRIAELSDGSRVERPDTEDEIADLADQMNELLDRLGAQQAVRRQFVSDASHELKSPVANARALIETSAGDSSRSQVLHELDRLQAIVDDLLFLARHDETASASETETVDLDDVVFAEAERLAAMSTKEVDASGVVPAQVAASRADVSRAVGNLLANAERHAQRRVTVSVGEIEGGWVVVVEDDGAGVPVAERERVFERFARADDGRARSSGGTGLGLAIVAAVADRWGGGVGVDDAPSGGGRFVLRLPREPGSVASRFDREST